MEFLKKLDLTGLQFVKLVGLVILGLMVLWVLANLFTNTFGRNSIGSIGINAPSMAPVYYDKSAGEYGAPALSVRNVGDAYLPPVDGGYTSGDESEAYEVKNYSTQIETNNKDRDCGAVYALKARTDVIFEYAQEYDRGCTYTFKVKKESVDNVLGIIQDLNPKDLRENSYTIKQEVDDYTSEITILEGKLASLDKTLADAVTSYENITALASRTGDVENLAKIIESKLTIIERLTSARIETANQLERMRRAKNESLDRLLYTYFSVTVYENKYANIEDIRDSWKAAVQEFVRETNVLLQDLSIGLVTLFLTIVKFALYFVILLFVARYGWTFAKKVWSGA